MTALMGQTLDNKEKIIAALQTELETETKRRRDHERKYKSQVKEFEQDQKILSNLKKESDRLEKKQ